MSVADEGISTALKVCYGGGGILSLLSVYSLFSTLMFNSDQRVNAESTFLTKPTGEISKYIKNVSFSKKPNIYIVYFDSLIPKSILKKHLGVDKAAYHDVLDKNLLKLNNFFVEQFPSNPSINKFLALNNGYYQELIKNKKQYDLYSGRVESPLMHMFKKNGYETSTMYNSHYFGKNQGPYIDNYIVNGDIGACEFIDKKYRQYVFFGLCNFSAHAHKVGARMRINSLTNYIKSKLNNKPQIIVSYIFSPGHTERDFLYNNLDKREAYTMGFLERSNETAKGINNLLSFLKKNDPNSITYILGDHGPYLSRRVGFKKKPVFVVHDRYAVYGGMFSRNNNCSRQFSQLNLNKYTVASQGALAIINCLSDKDIYSLDKGEYKLPKTLTSNPNNNKYENYLYE